MMVRVYRISHFKAAHSLSMSAALQCILAALRFETRGVTPASTHLHTVDV